MKCWDKDLCFKEYNLKLGHLFDSKNVEVQIKYFRHFKPSYNKKNYLFVSGEPSKEEKNKVIKKEVEVSPGGANLSNLTYNNIVENKKDESNTINLFLDSLDWYLISNKEVNKDCDDIITFLQNAGYEEREFDVYAGCSVCPCTPGFILNSENELITNTAIYINFKSN